MFIFPSISRLAPRAEIAEAVQTGLAVIIVVTGPLPVYPAYWPVNQDRAIAFPDKNLHARIHSFPLALAIYFPQRRWEHAVHIPHATFFSFKARLAGQNPYAIRSDLLRVSFRNQRAGVLVGCWRCQCR